MIVPDKINQLSDRTAMGVDEHYQPLRAELLSKELDRFRALPTVQLVAIAESTERVLEERLAAGVLLGWLGDPRVQVLDPAMVDIPGGSVSIGLEEEKLAEVTALFADTGCSRAWFQKECPAFQLQIKPFRMARYPVTNQEYLAFLKENPEAELPSSWVFGRYPAESANVPVYTIKAESGDAYAAWLSRKTSRKFRLPSEFEWEHAAAGPERWEFPWGNEYRADHGNTAESALLHATPIGIFARGRSYFGCLDMAGNIEEYTSTEYHAYPGGKLIEDDLFKLNPSYRIARGGSFTRRRDLMRCKRRHGAYPRALYTMGFRLAETL